MSPIEFMEKWNIGRFELKELLGLSESQVERWFFDPQKKNYQPPKQAHYDRLGEIDLILSARRVLESMEVFSSSTALRRLNRIIPA